MRCSVSVLPTLANLAAQRCSTCTQFLIRLSGTKECCLPYLTLVKILNGYCNLLFFLKKSLRNCSLFLFCNKLLKSKTRTEPTWLFTCVKDCQRLEVVKLTPSPHANDVTADAAYFNYLVQAKTVYPDLTSKSVVLTRCTDTICSVHQEDATVTSR